MSTTAIADQNGASVGAARRGPDVVTALQVETPENIVLHYQLAGAMDRCFAYLIDLAVRGVIFLVAALLIGYVGSRIWSGGVSIGMIQVFMFLTSWFYFVLSEMYFRGKSIGKQAMGIRVIQERGYPITFWSSCLRNFLRAADAMPVLFHFVGFYGVGYLSILLTKRGQRLGDLVAGTVVITERTVRLPREPIILEKIQPIPRNELLGNFTPSDRTLALVEEFLGRRYVLTHERGHALASTLASRLAERMNYQGDPKLVQQYPMAFLARVYVTFLKRADDGEEIASIEDSMIANSSIDFSRF